MEEDQIKGPFRYAWHGSGRRWDAVWLQAAGGAIGGAAIWFWGVKVPSEILDNPALSGVAAIAIGAICGALVAFVLRLCWWPIYRRYHPFGGLFPFLKAKLGVQMWPIVLMVSGLFLFVTVSGSGLVWLVIQTARGASPHDGNNQLAAQRPPQPAFVPDPQAQIRMQLFTRTAALGAKDKEELSAVFRGMAQTFGESDKLVLGLRQVSQDIKNHQNQIGRTLAEYIQRLDDLRKTAAALKIRLQDYSHSQYFDQQAYFIMGNDPNRADMDIPTTRFQNFLATLLTMQNKDAPFFDLVVPSLERFTAETDHFNSWLSGCESRLSELKQVVL